ncbi:DUF4124 domain-containing protein [Chitinimonas arctica]|nr:DUF4124 domain-containing protein [Chitinimonas arctica]
MRLPLVLIVAGLLAAAWWQRDSLMATLQPAQESKPVYRWTDAGGKVQYGDHPGAANAVQVQLKPLNIVKGASKAELAKASQPPASAATPAAPPASCEMDDVAAQARCIQAQTAPRNLALERVRQLGDQLGK